MDALLTAETLRLLFAQPAIVIVVAGCYWLMERSHKRELEAAKRLAEEAESHAKDVRSLMDAVLVAQAENTRALAALKSTLDSVAMEVRRRARQGGEAHD